jgi:NitT/TauT family transport system substrate-binding protein
MKRLASALPALLLGTLALAACGGGASAPPSSAPPASAAASPSAAAAKSASSAPSAKPATSAASASAKPAAASAAASGLIPIKAGYPQATVTQGPIFVGVDEGFFKNNGLDVSVQMIGGPNEVPAVMANEIQFAGVGATEVANAAQAGSQLVMIATYVDYPFFWLYAGKKYKAVPDLDGQTIGITAPGSSTDSAARLFLRHFNMEGKVKIAPAGGTQPGILAAMTQGGVAGGILSPPTTEEAAKQGFVELVNGVTLGVPMNTSGVVVTRPYLKDHLDVVKRFLKAYQQSWTFSGDPANQTEVIKVLAKYTKSDPATVEISYRVIQKLWQGNKMPSVNPEAVTNLLNLSDDPKIRATKPSDVIDNSILESVQ